MYIFPVMNKISKVLSVSHIKITELYQINESLWLKCYIIIILK